MTRATRWMLILCFITASIAVSWDFTPRTAGRDQAKGKGSASSLMQKQGGKSQSAAAGKSAQQSSKSAEKANAESENPDPEADDDPDLPPGMSGKVDKEAYLRARGDYFDMLRGRDGEVPEGARERAIHADGTTGKAVKESSSSQLGTIVRQHYRLGFHRSEPHTAGPDPGDPRPSKRTNDFDRDTSNRPGHCLRWHGARRSLQDDEWRNKLDQVV